MSLIPGANLPPKIVNSLVFVGLIIYALLDLNKEFTHKNLHGRGRWKVQISQSFVMIGAFILWTYSIRGVVWGDSYNAPLALILCIMFLAGTKYLPPMGITPKEAQDSGFGALINPAAAPPMAQAAAPDAVAAQDHPHQ